ncbi:MAG: DoxX family protein [Chitinophagales bacterium]|nr:DoxX family protein [Chitinophagales bacterium]
MKKLLTIKYKPWAFDLAILILRLFVGVLMAAHGFQKISHFEEYSAKFMDFMGLGQTLSLSLAIFAEFFCSILLVVGLFTRLATVPLIITIVVIFGVHKYDFFGEAELPTLFLAGYIVLLLVGPGRISLDGQLAK